MNKRAFFTCSLVLLGVTVYARNVNRRQYQKIKSYMDMDADPCEDYYQYACGNWKNFHFDVDYYETISFVDHKVNTEYARILKSVRRNNKTWQFKFVRNLHDYYKSCLEVDVYEPVKYLRWIETHENITWPKPLPASNKTYSSDKDSSFNWVHLLAVLRKYDFNGIFLEQTFLQQRDDGRFSLIDIDKPVLNGGFKPMTLQSFAVIMEYLGVHSSGRRKQLWEDVEMFEVVLLSLDDVEDDIGYQLSTLEALNMTWLEHYLSVVLEKPLTPRDMNITIQNIPYLHKLLEVLDEYEPEFIYRYIMIRFLWHLNFNGPNNFFKIDCVSHTRSQLPLAMAWLYERYNPRLVAETPNVEELFQTLLQHFQKQLNDNVNGLNASVLKFLSDKMSTIQLKVGNLPRHSTDDKLETFHKDLRIIFSDFHSNHLKVLRFNFLSRRKLLESQVPRKAEEFFHLEDADTGASSSPYYLLRSHIVIVPLTVLHPPIYHADLLPLFKYSSLGFLLAHELMHSVDYSGIDVDKRGNMRGPSEEIKANLRFDEQLSCLRSGQPDIVDEKIADVSGLRCSYESYFRNTSVALHKPLPWSEYSAERLFFLNFAQFFCANSDLVEMFDFSEHGTDRERVLAALANFEEFGRVYSCPVGSGMHPARKCQLWR